jgi:hypothetical protein
MQEGFIHGARPLQVQRSSWFNAGERPTVPATTPDPIASDHSARHAAKNRRNAMLAAALSIKGSAGFIGMPNLTRLRPTRATTAARATWE